MFKQIIALLLLIAFTAQTFNKAFIVFDYFANLKAFEKVCENKTRPQMHCKGKCQMMKKFKEEEKKDEQSPERKAENKNETVLSFENFYPVTHFCFSLQKKLFSDFISGQEIEMPRSILRPPDC